MSKALPNLTNTPPGGWRYAVPETQKTLGPFSGWIQLQEQLHGHYHAAGYPVPANLFDLVQVQICNAQPEYCGDIIVQGPLSSAIQATKHTFHAGLQCLTTLVSHRAGSGERPTQEQQEARAQVCAECPKNTDLTPCSICNIKSLQGLIKKMVGAKLTTVDAKLKFCEVCHCATAAKVATKHEAIWNHMPESQKKQLPEACWIATEFKAKEATYAE